MRFLPLQDLDDDGCSRFCFLEEAVRDRFAFALRNLAAGRAWDDTGEEPVRAHGQPIQFFAVLYSLALLCPLRSPEAMLLCLFQPFSTSR